MKHALLAILLPAALSGCALAPASLRGDFAPLTPAEAARGVQTAEPVRWGGVIAETRPDQDRTCFLVVDMPLDGSARPVRVDQSGGRFLACTQGFLDPEVYAPDRLLTVAGWLAGTSPEKVGDYAYEAPVVDAYTAYLWQQLPPGYGYAWGPGPYWGWGPGLWAYGGPLYGPWGPYSSWYRSGIW
jgi:outer membrane lipoprotein